MRFFILWFSMLVLSISSAYSQDDELAKINIVSSINPIYQVVTAITKDKVNNFLIYKKNYSEHNYQLKSADVKAIENADLVVMIDKNYENNLDKYLEQLSSSKKIITLSQIKQIKLLKLRKNSQKNDFHLWLNPQNITIFAQDLVENLCHLSEKNCQFFKDNLNNFIKENNLISSQISRQLTDLKNKNFIFYRDCYQYFEEYFALKPILILDDEHRKELKILRYKEFVNTLENQRVECLFGDINDENNSAQKLAKNHHLKFAKIDIIGLNDQEKNPKAKTKAIDLNGYSQILLNIATTIDNCLR